METFLPHPRSEIIIQEILGMECLSLFMYTAGLICNLKYYGFWYLLNLFLLETSHALFICYLHCSFDNDSEGRKSASASRWSLISWSMSFVFTPRNNEIICLKSVIKSYYGGIMQLSLLLLCVKDRSPYHSETSRFHLTHDTPSYWRVLHMWDLRALCYYTPILFLCGWGVRKVERHWIMT